MNKTSYFLFLLFGGLLLSSNSIAQPVNKLDQLIAKDTKIVKVASDFSFTEGPAVNKKGQIYFTDQPNNKIYIWNENDKIKEFPVDGERSNGLYFNKKGELISCADYRNKLIKIDMDGNKTVLVDQYEGKHLNGPNDVWVHPSGNIYITDSYYHRPWWPEDQKEIQDQRAVYCLKTTGEFIKVADGFKMPNGIVGSKDGKRLYVADINDGKTWQYTIQEDGSLTDKKFFAPKGSDGMTIDNQGNVYLTPPSISSISIYSKDGEKMGDLKIPEAPANVCFGGKNRKTLFVTARTSVYKLSMKVKGTN